MPTNWGFTGGSAEGKASRLQNYVLYRLMMLWNLCQAD